MTKRLFVVGVPCSGKTTLARYLRDTHGLNAVDMDDEIIRVNGGSWPDIEAKNNVVKPKVLEEVLAMNEVVLFYNPMSVDETQRLREAGFMVLLIDVSPAELRRRDAIRQSEEGWTNIEWFDWNQTGLAEFREHGLVDVEILGEREVKDVAADIVRLIGEGA